MNAIPFKDLVIYEGNILYLWPMEEILISSPISFVVYSVPTFVFFVFFLSLSYKAVQQI